MAELLAVLYGSVLRVNPADPDWPERDRFILSKGHGCAALYAVLAERGFFPLDWLETFCCNGSCLPGHATHTQIPGIEVSTGSLGHGLSLATGMAFAAKLAGEAHRVFVLISDGECDEGSTWEAMLFAAHHGLDNLTAIVDYNKIYSVDFVETVLALAPLAAKWHSFGWAVREIDGHNLEYVQATLSQVPYELGRPSCVIAHTVKGKGVSFMENQVLWHFRTPQGSEFEAALAELEASK
jgi:transketolase